MLRRSAVARVRAEIDALEACTERAGAALACVYSSSEEFEAAELVARRAAAPWRPFQIDGMRLVLSATALMGIAALAAIGALAAISL
jgi:hypothetical protein